MGRLKLKSILMKIKSIKIIIVIIFLIIGFKNYSQCVRTTSNCSGTTLPDSSIYIISPVPNNVDFSFDNITKYNGGITISGATTLKLKITALNASCKWKLLMYLDNSPASGDIWEKLPGDYGKSGSTPPVSLIQVRVYNTCGTPINNNAFQTFANITTVLPIIYDLGLIHPGNCNGSHVNTAGSYLNDFGEYTFFVDYRIQPSLHSGFKPGIYDLKIKFCLVEE